MLCTPRFLSFLQPFCPVIFAAALPAQANLPLELERFLASEAGAAFLTRTAEGKLLASKILPQGVAEAQQGWALSRILARASEVRDQTTHTLIERLDRVRARFGREREQHHFDSPPPSDGSSPVSYLLRTTGEMRTLRKIASEELGTQDLEFLARIRSSESAYASSKKLFEQGITATPGQLFAELALREGGQGLAQTAQEAFETYSRLISRHPALTRYLPETEVYALLAELEMTTSIERLQEILKVIEGESGRLGDRVRRAFRSVLGGIVPADMLAARLDFQNTQIPLRSRLGEFDLDETLWILYGGSRRNPAPESLLGRYIAETGAVARRMSFPRGPRARTEGPERLVVPVSRTSFAAWKRLFSLENFLFHVHTPGQGTLMLLHQGMAGTYGNLRHSFRAPEQGTLLPMIVLKSSEGQRARNFFGLAATQGKLAQRPWKIPGYLSQQGAYTSCTHWVGNIPIGDRRVTQYRFPGAVDEHASHQAPSTDPGPRVAEIREYAPLAETPDAGLLQRVWKAPGNEQLADAIGLATQNLRAELANPGYVAYSLIGHAPVERVPVVFVMVKDHQVPIPRDFDLRIEAY